MNREIKFRVWDAVNKEYINPNGYYFTVDFKQFMAFDRYFDVDEEELVIQQYTGLKDKNGKEIYEGDIVKFDNSESNWRPFGTEQFVGKAEIIWCNDLLLCNTPRWGLFRVPDKDGHRRYYDSTHGEIEVVGNIFENGDLLNE